MVLGVLKLEGIWSYRIRARDRRRGHECMDELAGALRRHHQQGFHLYGGR